MVHRSHPGRSRANTLRPFVAFLIIASFGILFAGCKGPEDSGSQDFVFTQENLDQAHQLAQNAVQQATGSGTAAQTGTGTSPYLEPIDTGSGASSQGVVLDLSMLSTYNSIRQGQGAAGQDVYQVTNTFLNVRKTPSTGAESVGTLHNGDNVVVMSFPNAAWAQVKLSDGTQGYVSIRYIAKVTTNDQLAAEKAKFDGQYYVHYAFVNMRKEANQQSDKIGEIPGQTIVKPDSISGDWAKVTYNGQTGYVSKSYLAPFMPYFVVRQNSYTLPVLHYQLSSGQEDSMLKAIADDTAALKQKGISFITFSAFRDKLIAQQSNGTQINDTSAIVAVTGITPDNVKKVSDALLAAHVPATLFINTKDVGLSGITQKTLLTLSANGFDIQSAGHTGDDLRALTNSQAQLELQQSRKILEEMTNKPVFAVAYPLGGTNERIMQLADQAGYLFGLAGGSERTYTRDQLLDIPGIDIFPTMSADEVVKLVRGS
ncbi:MAG TPA: SH3 domain-containing protein [Candidatus Peribacteraceae bacterium]|nr:SH3 domain-containing protein [Candidatus Peribacteraceae bacterium]